MKAILFLLLFLSTFSITSPARDSQRGRSREGVREYCGKSDSAQPKGEFFYWDCAHVQATSMHDLEIEVAKTHSVPDFAKDKERSKYYKGRYYESNDPHYTRWVFVSDTRAIRYRQLFDGDSWKGIGVTIFCSEDVAECEKFVLLSTAKMPEPEGLKFGPPSPKPPAPIAQIKEPHIDGLQETALVPDHRSHMKSCVTHRGSTEDYSMAQAECQCQFEHFPARDSMTKAEFLNAALNCKHEREENLETFVHKYLAHLKGK